MTLGEKVHLLRRRLDWTQRELARVACINLNTVARIERDEIRDPSGQMILRLARALETTTDYLLGREEVEEEALTTPHV